MQFEALKIGELARRSGLTVRTLHHYDGIGLLKPSHRTESGHRLYTAGDVARLQQVLSLRQLGFALDDIGDCLGGKGFSPMKVIGLHIDRMRQQIGLQQELCARLEAIAGHLRAAEDVTTEAFFEAIEVMAMIENLYTPEQMKQFQEAGARAGADEIRAVEEAWTALLTEVRASQQIDPASPEAQALAERWDELSTRTMRGYEAFPDLKQAIAENYEQGRFEGHAYAPQAADFALIEQVEAARKRSREDSST